MAYISREGTEEGIVSAVMTFNPVGPDLLQEIQHLSYEELALKKAANLQALSEIASQIEEAEAMRISHKVYADPDWWRRVHSAQKIRGQLDQAIQLRMSALRRQEREHHRQADESKPKTLRVMTLPQVFMQVAEEWLPQSTFGELLAEALARNGTPISQAKKG